MKVLILGGTRFLGRHLAQEALQRGHKVTLFNRGNHTVSLSGIEMLLGDRDGDLTVLQDRDWDAVIDTCGFVPRTVAKTAKLLGERIKHYTYISSISVYKDWIPYNIDEEYPVQAMPAHEVEGVTAGTAGPVYEYYGPLKALCEQEAEAYLPGKVLSVRAGQIVGAFDYTDRFPYWVRRIHDGGRVLCPGNPHRPVQLIDARDMAAWILTMAQQRITGTYNVTGPSTPLTMLELFEACKRVSGSDAEFIWTQEEFLLDHDVTPWVELPLWLPENFVLPGEAEPWKGAFSISNEKALQNGLQCRKIEHTIHDVLQWELLRPSGERKTGITRERERELLELWGNIKIH